MNDKREEEKLGDKPDENYKRILKMWKGLRCDVVMKV